jgi:hypothetical protein
MNTMKRASLTRGVRFFWVESENMTTLLAHDSKTTQNLTRRQ